MLRMANHECVKNQAKEITKCMLRCIQTENERNAILALKVLADVWKANKLYYLNEVSMPSRGKGEVSAPVVGICFNF